MFVQTLMGIYFFKLLYSISFKDTGEIAKTWIVSKKQLEDKACLAQIEK